MKILEIFENKLRYKNYSQNTIKTYKQTLYQYFKETNCKDPYKMCPRMPRALGSLERGGKEKRRERFKETGK